MTLSYDEIRSRLAPFSIDLTLDQLDLVRKYIELLELWNRKISLVSPSDMGQLVQRHLGESFFGASAVGIHDGRLADVGTGAGFPGIPLKIAAPGLDMTLIESNQRKAAFLSETIRTLRLTSCRVNATRFDEVDPQEKFKFVTSRALGNYPALLKWASSRLIEGGKIALWLGSEDASHLSAEPGWKWHVPIPIPGSDRRVLLVGTAELSVA